MGNLRWLILPVRLMACRWWSPVACGALPVSMDVGPVVRATVWLVGRQDADCSSSQFSQETSKNGLRN